VENRDTGKRSHTSSAYLTFVALLEEGPVPVPPLLCKTEDEKRRFAEGQKRRAHRLKLLGKD
jgi:acyl-CoA hydrolase